MKSRVLTLFLLLTLIKHQGYSLAPSHQMATMEKFITTTQLNRQKQADISQELYCLKVNPSEPLTLTINGYPQKFNHITLENAERSMDKKYLLRILQTQLPLTIAWMQQAQVEPVALSLKDLSLIQDPQTGQIISCAIQENKLIAKTQLRTQGRELQGHKIIMFYLITLTRLGGLTKIFESEIKTMQTNLNPTEMEELARKMNLHLTVLDIKGPASVMAVLNDPFLREYLAQQGVDTSHVQLIKRAPNGILMDAHIAESKPIILSNKQFQWLKHLHTTSKKNLPPAVAHTNIDFGDLPYQVGQPYKKDVQATTVVPDDKQALVVVHQPQRTSLAQFMSNEFPKLPSKERVYLFNQLVTVVEQLYKRYPNVSFQNLSLQDFSIVPVTPGQIRRNLVSYAIQFQALDKMLPKLALNASQREQHFTNCMLELLWEVTIADQPPRSTLGNIAESLARQTPTQKVNSLKALMPHVILPTLAHEITLKKYNTRSTEFYAPTALYHLCTAIQNGTSSVQQTFELCKTSHPGKYPVTATQQQYKELWQKVSLVTEGNQPQDFIKVHSVQQKLQKFILENSPLSITKFVYLASSLPEEITSRQDINPHLDGCNMINQYCMRLCMIYLGYPSPHQDQLVQEISWLQKQLTLHRVEYQETTLKWLRLTEMLHIKHTPNSFLPQTQRNLFGRSIKLNIPATTAHKCNFPKFNLGATLQPSLLSKDGTFYTIIIPLEWMLQYQSLGPLKNADLFPFTVLLLTQKEVNISLCYPPLKKALSMLPPHITKELSLPPIHDNDKTALYKLMNIKTQLERLEKELPPEEVKGHLGVIIRFTGLVIKKQQEQTSATPPDPTRTPNPLRLSQIKFTPQTVHIFVLQEALQKMSQSEYPVEYYTTRAIWELAVKFPDSVTISQMFATPYVTPDTHTALSKAPFPRSHKTLLRKAEMTPKEILMFQKDVLSLQDSRELFLSPDTEPEESSDISLQKETKEHSITLQIHAIINTIINQSSPLTTEQVSRLVQLQTILVAFTQEPDPKVATDICKKLLSKMPPPTQKESWFTIFKDLTQNLEIGSESAMDLETHTEQHLGHLSKLRILLPQNEELQQYEQTLQERTALYQKAHQIAMTMHHALAVIKQTNPKINPDLNTHSLSPCPNIIQTVADATSIFMETLRRCPHNHLSPATLITLNIITQRIQLCCNTEIPPNFLITNLKTLQDRISKTTYDEPIKNLLDGLITMLKSLQSITENTTNPQTPVMVNSHTLETILSTIQDFQQNALLALQLPPLSTDQAEQRSATVRRERSTSQQSLLNQSTYDGQSTPSSSPFSTPNLSRSSSLSSDSSKESTYSELQEPAYSEPFEEPAYSELQEPAYSEPFEEPNQLLDENNYVLPNPTSDSSANPTHPSTQTDGRDENNYAQLKPTSLPSNDQAKSPETDQHGYMILSDLQENPLPSSPYENIPSTPTTPTTPSTDSIPSTPSTPSTPRQPLTTQNQLPRSFSHSPTNSNSSQETIQTTSDEAQTALIRTSSLLNDILLKSNVTTDQESNGTPSLYSLGSNLYSSPQSPQNSRPPSLYSLGSNTYSAPQSPQNNRPLSLYSYDSSAYGSLQSSQMDRAFSFSEEGSHYWSLNSDGGVSFTTTEDGSHHWSLNSDGGVSFTTTKDGSHHWSLNSDEGFHENISVQPENITKTTSENNFEKEEEEEEDENGYINPSVFRKDLEKAREEAREQTQSHQNKLYQNIGQELQTLTPTLGTSTLHQSSVSSSAFLFANFLTSPQSTKRVQEYNSFERRCKHLLQEKIQTRFPNNQLDNPIEVISSFNHPYNGLLVNVYDEKSSQYKIFIHPFLMDALTEMDDSEAALILEFLLSNEYSQITMKNQGTIPYTAKMHPQTSIEIVSMVNTFVHFQTQNGLTLERSHTLLHNFIEHLHLVLEVNIPEGLENTEELNVKNQLNTLNQIFLLAQKCQQNKLTEPLEIIQQFEQQDNFEKALKSVEMLRTFA